MLFFLLSAFLVLLVSVVFYLGRNMSLMRRLMHGPMCPSSARIDGKTVIITGANCGIGKETARELASRGGRVIMACRDEAKAREAADDIEKSLDGVSNTGSVLVKPLDLASLESVRRFARDIIETEPRVDILINNGGLMLCPQMKTKEGYEMQFGVNHLGHFLLTNLLLDRLKRSAPSRIVNVSSSAHKYGRIDFDDIQSEKNYSPYRAYGQSKLANILFTHELAKKLKGTGVTSYALHPGMIRSDLFRYCDKTMSSFVPWLISTVVGTVFMKTVVEGAQTTIYCAVAEELEDKSGLYYIDCALTKPISLATDDDTASKLWDLSCKLTELDSEM